jgi:DNA invertase Pin-like site-specific DNA recombinase
VQEYRDEGVSGTCDAPDRPALTELLAAVNDGPVRLVLVERADRLARDLVIGELLLAEFQKLGVAVVSVDGGVDMTAADIDPTKKLIRQLLGALAEWEKTALVMKLRAARQRIRRTAGRCEGDKPFGSKPGEAVALNRIRYLARKPPGGRRPSAGQIAASLNAEGFTSRSGQPWNRGSVWAILRRIRCRK